MFLKTANVGRKRQGRGNWKWQSLEDRCKNVIYNKDKSSNSTQKPQKMINKTFVKCSNQYKDYPTNEVKLKSENWKVVLYFVTHI